MKPKKAPADLEWHELPTFDTLLGLSRLKVSLLRLKLADVPCWKCVDNTVRYDCDAAELAIAESVDAKAENGDITAMGLLDKQIQINERSAKQQVELLKAMSEPLRMGMEMWLKAWERQEKRLGNLEGNIDRMYAVIESGLTSEHERELAMKKHDASVELRGKTFNLLKEQGPKIIDKWAMTTKARVAVELIDSLDPDVVDSILATDILEPDQMEKLRQLRKLKPNRNGVAPSSSNAEAAAEPEPPPTTNGAP